MPGWQWLYAGRLGHGRLDLGRLDLRRLGRFRLARLWLALHEDLFVLGFNQSRGTLAVLCSATHWIPTFSRLPQKGGDTPIPPLYFDKKTKRDPRA